MKIFNKPQLTSTKPFEITKRKAAQITTASTVVTDSTSAAVNVSINSSFTTVSSENTKNFTVSGSNVNITLNASTIPFFYILY